MNFPKNQWALILGGSSGFGLATAKKLASHGLSVAIIHRDRRSSMARIAAEFDSIREFGGCFLSINADALAPQSQKQILETIKKELAPNHKIRILLHSIALGNLKPLVSKDPDQATLEDDDFLQSIYNMGSSLWSWARSILDADLFATDARVLSLTSEGNQIAWPGYAAISAAKAALEAISRSMALELAPHGIRTNVVQAGITDTPASRLIPGISGLRNHAIARNPFGRLTQPTDVANALYLLCTDEAAWINGAVIRVDGGEHIAGGMS